MARLLDYQFDTFSTDANGNRVIVNAGTLGSSNDAVMHTGQGLEFDGVDDYIDTETLDFASGGTVIYVGPDDGYSGIWDGSNRLYLGTFDDTKFYFGWGSGYSQIDKGNTPINQFNRYIITSDNTGAVDCFVNNTSVDTFNGTISDPFTNKFRIGQRSDGSSGSIVGGIICGVCVLNKKITSSDVDYDYNNPNALLNMYLKQTDDPNFSFSYADILHIWTLDEGTGNTVYDLVTGDSYSLINFPTDDTQWTNADEESKVHQKERYKKDAHGNPAAPADPNTIRFD